MSKSIDILMTIPIPEPQVAELRAISPRLNIRIIPASKAEDIPEEAWDQMEILYTNRALPEPEQAPNLKWIQFHWAGVEDVLDAPILHQPGIQASTLSGAAASQMAEYIVMMILALGHRLPDLMAHQKRAEWARDRWERFLPLEIRGSTVGIVGYGSIGRQVARLLQPFGAQVLASKRDAMHPEDHNYIPEGMGDPSGDLVRRLYPGEALRSMFAECDFIVITVPKTKKTLRLIGAEELEVLKPSAFLIDVSRGGIVDQVALIQALKDKKLAGAALDVFPEEPLPADNPLWKVPNVIVTPHISGNTPHYIERAMQLFKVNLQRYLEGEPPLNQIELERGY